jgi:hypothetical protein
VAEARPARPAPPPRWAWLAVAAAGIGIRLWQYLGNPSLWIDELALVEDVLHLPLRALLTRPLPLDQIAAPGFLAALKASAAWLGTDERALRAFPFLCALASVPLFAALARRVQPAWTALFALAAFSLLPLLVSWSASVKQYSTDVAVALAVLLAALRALDRPLGARALAACAAAGAIAPWLSHPAAFTVAGCGVVLLAAALPRSGRAASPSLLGAVALWAASAGGAAALARSLLTESTRDYMARFWTPSLPDATTLALVALGAALLVRRGARVASVLLAPVALTLIASALHAYPFSGRAVLFLVPIFVLAAAEAGGLLAEGLAAAGIPRAAAATLIVAPLLAALARNLPVYRREEMRPLLERLAPRLREDDSVYVYYGASRGFRFYAPRAGIGTARASIGGCHRGDPIAYLRELDAFRGRPRVWVVIAHPTTHLREAPTIRGYLEEIGARGERIVETGASAELFDLSDLSRLSRATADTFPLPAASSSPEESGYGCGHGPIGWAPWES